MKIAFIAKEYPPHGLLRAATAIFYPKLSKALLNRGYEIHVITQSFNGSKREYTSEDGIHVHEVGPRPKTGSPIRRALFSLNAALKARELVKRYRLEIIETSVFGGEGFFYSILKSAPLVVDTFAFGEMMLQTKTYKSIFERVFWKISAFLEEITLKKADVIIANSPSTYYFLIEKKKLPKEKIFLIWESRIDLNKFKPVSSDIRKRFQIAEESPLILYVGWLQARKGIHYLCETMPLVIQKFPEAVFLLKGEDTNTAPGGVSFKKYIFDFAKKHGFSKNVKIIEEFLSKEDIVALYSACDVFVFPSLYETFGWPIVEAMACERPVVATDTGIARELKGKGLFVVPLKDSTALAQGLIYFLSMSREKREEIGRDNRKVVEQTFSFEKMVKKYLKVYEKLIPR
jgi:glycosyltransferase involved in cell wall biosynthesis